MKFIFEVMLTFEILTVHGQQHSFSNHKRRFFRKCRRFWDRKCIHLRGTIEPLNFGFMPNVLTIPDIWARHFLSHALNTGSGDIDIFYDIIYMSIVYLFYKVFIIWKIMVASISYSWSNATSNTAENNGFDCTDDSSAGSILARVGVIGDVRTTSPDKDP